MTATALTLPGLNEPLEPGEVFFSLKIAGHPQHKARHRSRLVTPRFKKPFIQNYPDPKTEKFERYFAQLARIQMRALKRSAPTKQPICLLVIADREIPASWPKSKRQAALDGRVLPTSKPDWDNHGKITDALSGVVWVDDAQIVDARVIKRYAVQPALRIEVREFVAPKR